MKVHLYVSVEIIDGRNNETKLTLISSLQLL